MEEILVGAIENMGGVIDIQKYLTGGVRSGGERGITRLRVIARVVEEENPLIGNQGRRTRLDEVAVEHALAWRKDRKKIFAVFSDQRGPFDEVIGSREEYVRVAEIHPVLSAYASRNQLSVFQPCDDGPRFGPLVNKFSLVRIAKRGAVFPPVDEVLGRSNQ